MSGALALLLATSQRTIDHISGAALGAALLVLFVCLALVLATWNDDEDDDPRPVRPPLVPGRGGFPLSRRRCRDRREK